MIYIFFLFPPSTELSHFVVCKPKIKKCWPNNFQLLSDIKDQKFKRPKKVQVVLR